MTKPYFKAILLSTLAVPCLGFSHVALADKHGHGHDRDDDYRQEQYYGDNDHDRYRDRDDDDRREEGRPRVIVIDPRDRVVIRDYVVEDYRRHCPPGLAKKHNGCLPPGHAKRYRVGYALPRNVVYVPVEPELRERLSPVPAGYEYVRVDRDVLLISEATKKVIDAVVLYSAVGR